MCKTGYEINQFISQIISHKDIWWETVISSWTLKYQNKYLELKGSLLWLGGLRTGGHAECSIRSGVHAFGVRAERIAGLSHGKRVVQRGCGSQYFHKLQNEALCKHWAGTRAPLKPHSTTSEISTMSPLHRGGNWGSERLVCPMLCPLYLTTLSPKGNSSNSSCGTCRGDEPPRWGAWDWKVPSCVPSFLCLHLFFPREADSARAETLGCHTCHCGPIPG